MFIQVTCECGAHYRVGEHLAGKKVRCKKCKTPVLVPRAEAEEAIDADDFGEYDLAQTPAPLPVASRRSYAPAVGGDDVGEASPLPRGDYSLNGTVASNPGRMRVQWIKYVSSFPIKPLVFLGLLVASLLLGLFTPAIFIVSIALGMGGLGWLRTVRAKFVSGCVNPGVVVSTSPYRVAVYTDLSKGGGFRPAVKILRQPLGRMTGGAPAVGTRLATAALYYGDAGGSWADFHPVVVNCATSNQADINRVTRSITANDWRQLDEAMERVANTKPGLHTLWDNDTMGRGQRARMVYQPIFTVAAAALAVMVLISSGAGKKLMDRLSSKGSSGQAGVAVNDTPVVVPESAGGQGVKSGRNNVVADVPVVSKPIVKTNNVVVVTAATKPVAVVLPATKAVVLTPPQTTKPVAIVLPATKPVAVASATTKPVLPKSATTKPAPVVVATPGALTYVVGERVEVYWGSSWFPAKVLKLDGAKTRIHYVNDSDVFDEWVPANRIRKVKAGVPGAVKK